MQQCLSFSYDEYSAEICDDLKSGLEFEFSFDSYVPTYNATARAAIGVVRDDTEDNSNSITAYYEDKDLEGESSRQDCHLGAKIKRMEGRLEATLSVQPKFLWSAIEKERNEGPEVATILKSAEDGILFEITAPGFHKVAPWAWKRSGPCSNEGTNDEVVARPGNCSSLVFLKTSGAPSFIFFSPVDFDIKAHLTDIVEFTAKSTYVSSDGDGAELALIFDLHEFGASVLNGTLRFEEYAQDSIVEDGLYKLSLDYAGRSVTDRMIELEVAESKLGAGIVLTTTDEDGNSQKSMFSLSGIRAQMSAFAEIETSEGSLIMVEPESRRDRRRWSSQRGVLMETNETQVLSRSRPLLVTEPTKTWSPCLLEVLPNAPFMGRAASRR